MLFTRSAEELLAPHPGGDLVIDGITDVARIYGRRIDDVHVLR